MRPQAGALPLLALARRAQLLPRGSLRGVGEAVVHVVVRVREGALVAAGEDPAVFRAVGGDRHRVLGGQGLRGPTRDQFWSGLLAVDEGGDRMRAERIGVLRGYLP